MSEIPFVNQLGDALETAIARPRRVPSRRGLGRRRYLAVALAALAVAGGGAAVAEMLADPAELGLGNIACYSGPGMRDDVAIVGLGDPGRSPVDICAEALAGEGVAASDLVACRDEAAILVLRRPERGGCARYGFAAVPPAYAGSRERVARLRDHAVALEQRAGCLPPRELARRLQALLGELGWAGWRAVVREGEGECGRLTSLGGSHVRQLADVNLSARTIAVTAGMPIDLERMLYGSDSLGVRLIDSSGGRCFTVDELKEHARRLLAPARLARTPRPIEFRVRALPANQGIESPRGERYEDGCAVSGGPYPIFRDGRTAIGVDIGQRDAPRLGSRG